MSVYQVAIIFEAESDKDASLLAEKLGTVGAQAKEDGLVNSPKISFTKFEKEATEVDSE